MGEIISFVLRGIQCFPLYLENYMRYQKMFYTKFLQQNYLYSFISIIFLINNFFQIKKIFFYFSKIFLIWMNGSSNFIVKFLYKTFLIFRIDFRDIQDFRGITEKTKFHA